jgi:hypothetical protein
VPHSVRNRWETSNGFAHLCGALHRIHSVTSMGNLNTERVVLVNHILGLSVFYPAFFPGSEYWFELKGFT